MDPETGNAFFYKTTEEMKTVNAPHTEADGSQGFSSTTTKVITDEKHWFIKTEPEMEMEVVDPWNEGEHADPFAEPWGRVANPVEASQNPEQELTDLNQDFANPLYAPDAASERRNFTNPLFKQNASRPASFVEEAQPEGPTVGVQSLAAALEDAVLQDVAVKNQDEAAVTTLLRRSATARGLASQRSALFSATEEDDLAMASFNTYLNTPID